MDRYVKTPYGEFVVKDFRTVAISVYEHDGRMHTIRHVKWPVPFQSPYSSKKSKVNYLGSYDLQGNELRKAGNPIPSATQDLKGKVQELLDRLERVEHRQEVDRTVRIVHEQTLKFDRMLINWLTESLRSVPAHEYYLHKMAKEKYPWIYAAYYAAEQKPNDQSEGPGVPSNAALEPGTAPSPYAATTPPNAS